MCSGEVFFVMMWAILVAKAWELRPIPHQLTTFLYNLSFGVAIVPFRTRAFITYMPRSALVGSSTNGVDIRFDVSIKTMIGSLQFL